MVKSDTWRKRKCVVNYWNYKDNLVIEAKKAGYELGDVFDGVTFILPMAKSWSKKKKAEMDGQPHQQKPDLDNLCKAMWDCLSAEDSNIHTIHNVRKVWGHKGQIQIK